MKLDEKLQLLKSQIVEHLTEIDGDIKEWGLDLRRLTLIARDPDNDESIVVVSNDDEAEAFDVALQQIENPTDQ